MSCRNSAARVWSFVLCVIVIFVLGVVNAALSQYTQPSGGTSPAGAASSPSPTDRLLQVIPSISVSERYDSNVFFVPPTPGLRRGDYVTNISPNLQVNHSGDFASGFLSVGGFGETYINNPDLNYVGGIGRLYFNPNNSLKKLLPRASLEIMDSITYTPQPPAFVNPSAGTSPTNPSNIQNSFAIGLQASRVDSLINNGKILGSYATTSTTSLEASYTNALIRFGSSPTRGSGFIPFNTTTQITTAGGTAKLTGQDTGSVKYLHSSVDFSSSGSSFQTNGATIGWSRQFWPNLSADLNGGVVSISGGQNLEWIGNATVVVSSEPTFATITYSRAVSPSFVGTAAAIISDVVSVSASYNMTPQWQLNATANYGHGYSINSTTPVGYVSYTALGGINYLITRIWSVGLNYNYSLYHQQSSGQSRDFDRNVVMLSLKAVWN